MVLFGEGRLNKSRSERTEQSRKLGKNDLSGMAFKNILYWAHDGNHGWDHENDEGET